MSKIRQGFVSNSSSSSFLIYGITLEPNYFNDPKFDELKQKVCDEKKKRYPNSKYSIEDIDTYEIVEELCTNMEFHYPEGYDCYFIGKSWDRISDDETGKQFKDSIEKQLKEILKDDSLKFETFEECFYN